MKICCLQMLDILTCYFLIGFAGQPFCQAQAGNADDTVSALHYRNNANRQTNSIHRKAKYNSLLGNIDQNNSVKNLNVSSLVLFTNDTNKNVYLMCANSNHISRRKFQSCVLKYLHHTQQTAKNLRYSQKWYRNSKAYKRRLLSINVHRTRTTTTATTNSTSFDTLSEQELKELMVYLRQKLSKDPQRALYSVGFLLVLLMIAIKLCGMKPLKNQREINRDFQEDVQYLGIYDILKMKKPYLPKKILEWNRKVRRKLRKKKHVVKIREQDLGAPGSDTDEETPLFARVYDF